MDERIGVVKNLCRYPKCKNKYYMPITKPGFRNKHFYGFPKNDIVARQWRDNCNIGDNVKTDRYYLCEDHFAPNDFCNQSRHRLNPGVVPEKYQDLNANGKPDIEIVTVTVSTTEETEYIPFKSSFLFDNNKQLNASSSSSDMESKKLTMQSIHEIVIADLLKLTTTLHEEYSVLRTLIGLYEDEKFDHIVKQLNNLTYEYLEFVLKDVTPVMVIRWMKRDYFLAMSLYIKDKKLYMYLSAFFSLPPVKILKQLLDSIPFKTGINDDIMDHIKQDIVKMNLAKRTCILMMAEMQLTRGVRYDETQQQFCGYEDLGFLGRSVKQADRVLVLMIRGLRKSWTQVVSYYFSCGPVKSLTLQNIIVKTINHLQSMNLNVVAFVCEQNSTSFDALSLLCDKTENHTNSYYFMVNYKQICIVYSTPQLVMETRNALAKCKIIYDENLGKVAKFEHIECAYNLDQSERIYKHLRKLKDEYFDVNNSVTKTNITSAIATLSHSVASTIESFVLCGKLPQEAMQTAEFVETMDMLFDSLNGPAKEKDFRKFTCILFARTPHLRFWTTMLTQLKNWKLIDLSSEQDVTSLYSFIKGWEVSLESLINIWNHLNQNRFSGYLPLNHFSLAPLENLFNEIAKYGSNSKSPTCYEFVSALKCVSLNGNQRDSYSSNKYYNLNSLRTFTENVFSSGSENELETYFDNLEFEVILNLRFHEEAAYLSGYLLQKMDIPDCQTCRSYLLAEWVINNNENELPKGQTYSLYASDPAIRVVDKILYLLNNFLRDQSIGSNLEDNFKTLHKHEFEQFKWCAIHNSNEELINLCIKLGIYRFEYCFNNNIILNK